MLAGLPVAGIPTPAQLARAERCAVALRRERKAAAFIPIMQNRRPQAVGDGERAEVNCASCVNISDFDAEHNSGWCLKLRQMKSTWHPCHCNAYVRGES